MRRVIAGSLLLCAAGCMGNGSPLPAAGGTDIQLTAAATSFAPLAPLPEARLADDRFIARDGTQLPLRRWLPEGVPAAVVLALHGFNDYSNAFAGLGPVLARRGIATYAYDQRGFGAAPERGRWAGENRMVADAATAVALLRRRYPDMPLYLLGESMGGAVAILAASRAGAARADLDGVIIVAPAVWGRQAMSLVERVGLWLADLMPAMQWSPDTLPVKVLASDNLPMLRALGADPLVIKATRSDTINGLVDLMGDALVAARRFDLRALLLYGEHDQIVPLDPVRQFVEALPSRSAGRQRIAFYPEGYHMLTRDLEGPLVVGDIAAWIANPSAALPSGADREGRARLLGRPEADEPTPEPAPIAAANP
ncbi:MAG TPA: lysophospholipase [Stellaceae bacterium]|nr:lysophospholipase [Stellaceae bacterium]